MKTTRLVSVPPSGRSAYLVDEVGDAIEFRDVQRLDSNTSPCQHPIEAGLCRGPSSATDVDPGG